MYKHPSPVLNANRCHVPGEARQIPMHVEADGRQAFCIMQAKLNHREPVEATCPFRSEKEPLFTIVERTCLLSTLPCKSVEYCNRSQ